MKHTKKKDLEAAGWKVGTASDLLGPAPIYDLKVTLQEVEPAIWRRIHVPSDITLFKLHGVLQLAMGWKNSHLHEFEVRGEFYGTLDPELPQPRHDEKKTTLDEVLRNEQDWLVYGYDFGDNWLHDVVLEKVAKPEPGVTYPVVVAGERAGPPEDCGGIPGYQDLLEALKDPSHPSQQDMVDWIGSFDSEAFDIAKVNRTLAARSRPKARAR